MRLYQKDTLTQVLPVNVAKILRTAVFVEHLWQLLTVGVP